MRFGWEWGKKTCWKLIQITYVWLTLSLPRFFKIYSVFFSRTQSWWRRWKHGIAAFTFVTNIFHRFTHTNTNDKYNEKDADFPFLPLSWCHHHRYSCQFLSFFAVVPRFFSLLVAFSYCVCVASSSLPFNFIKATHQSKNVAFFVVVFPVLYLLATTTTATKVYIIVETRHVVIVVKNCIVKLFFRSDVVTVIIYSGECDTYTKTRRRTEKRNAKKQRKSCWEEKSILQQVFFPSRYTRHKKNVNRSVFWILMCMERKYSSLLCIGSVVIIFISIFFVFCCQVYRSTSKILYWHRCWLRRILWCFKMMTMEMENWWGMEFWVIFLCVRVN